MEDKLLDGFRSFCKFNCKYKKGEIIIEKINLEKEVMCWRCHEMFMVDNFFTHTDLSPCSYCQIEEFIRDIENTL